jgi:response regulator RpfG family c-di-GMP phosphodiesterase/CheY-like chemotaxis protein
MDQILVISDNEILNQLYVTNLEVYLGVKVVVVESTKKAFELLKNNTYKLVITINMINGLDSATELYDHLNAIKYKTKMVAIGHPSKELGEVIVVANSYNLQNLIRACAQELGVTAKDMASKEVPKYYAIENKFLARIKEVPCAVYMQLKGGEYTMVARKGDAIGESVHRFTNEGVTTLYVNSLDRLSIINLISVSIVDFLKSTEGLETNDKVEAVKTGFQFSAANFSQSAEVTAEIMNIAKASSKVMEEIVSDIPGLKKLLTVLNSDRDGYVYTHSMLAAYVSNHIIRRVSWGGESHIEKINFVLFFHDIMLVPIYMKHPHLKYEEDLLFSDELDDKEKEVVLNHARTAAELVVTYKRAPIGADLLIKQHHGMTNGVGFATEFKDDISPLSKIVLVAEAFVEEFMRMREQNPNYQLDPKKIVVTLNEKFKRTTYKKIVETLESFPV